MSQGLIDIHQHLIYGVDDGPKKWEDTIAMLTAANNQGVARIIATSHVFPGRVHFDYDGYLAKIDSVNKFAEEKGWKIRVVPGAEIYYTSKTLDMLVAQSIPTLVNSRYLLVEFQPEVKSADLFRALRELLNGGYKPILAHVERYLCLADEPELLQQLRSWGILIQMNASTVLKSKGWLGGKRFIRKLLKDDIVDFVATDAHNTTTRPVCLKEAYQFLEKHYGKEKADRLTWMNQSMLLPALHENPTSKED